MKKTLLIAALIMCGCTDNTSASRYGGTQTINLPKGEKFVNCTWKLSDATSSMWYLTRPMRTNEVAETFTFREKSAFGVLEGKVIFIETK